MADVFKALADPTRRALLDELSERGDQTLFELCARLATKHHLGSSRQAISQHLTVLEEAGLLQTRRQGRCKLHTLDLEPLRHAVDRWLERIDQEDRCGSNSQASSSTTSRKRSASTPTSSASRRRQTSRSASTAG